MRILAQAAGQRVASRRPVSIAGVWSVARSHTARHHVGERRQATFVRAPDALVTLTTNACASAMSAPGYPASSSPAAIRAAGINSGVAGWPHTPRRRGIALLRDTMSQAHQPAMLDGTRRHQPVQLVTALGGSSSATVYVSGGIAAASSASMASKISACRLW